MCGPFGGVARVHVMSSHEEQPVVVTATKRTKRRRREEIPEQGRDQQLTRGVKLTRERRDELIRAIRNGLIGGMHPSTLAQACVTQFRLTRHTVAKYIALVRAEQLKEVGYYREQIQEICQKALVTIVRKDTNNDSAKVRAVQMLHNIFDIRVTPEDTTQAQRMFAEEAMQKMDKMTVQELQEFADNLRSGGDKLTPEMLLMSPAEYDEIGRKAKKKRTSRHARDY